MATKELKKLSIRASVTEEMKRKVEAEARAEYVSEGHVVRTALRFYFDHKGQVKA